MDISQITTQIAQYVFVMNILLAVALVFFERRKPTATWAWLMVLFFLPVFGFIIYLLFGQDMRKQKVFALKQEEEHRLQNIIDKQEAFIKADTLEINESGLENHLDVIYFHLLSNMAPYTQDNEVKVYHEGNTKFDDMIEDLKGAEKYIHLEYYIIRDDHLGREILALLTKKASEGVEIKVLFDGMGCIKLPKDFFKAFVKAGGQIACFYPPLLPYINVRMNYRNHRKICIIDGKTSYVGGLNIGDEYLGLSKKFGFWRDTHLKISGSAVDYLQLRFFLDWRFAAKEELIYNKKYFPKREKIQGVGMQIVTSGPDSKWSSIRNGYFKMINEAEKSVYIQTPYFVPDDSILEALRVSALSGIDVKIIIPGKPDHPFVHWASLSYLGDLLQAGVKCYTYDKGFVHSKIVLVDGLMSSVGTGNMDIRSFKLNFEVNAFIYNRKTTEELENQFMKDLEECTEVTMETYKQRSTIIKFKESVSRLLSPIL